MAAHRLYLASASPRRRQLLEQLRLSFKVQVAEVDETPRPGELPADYVLRLARTKAESMAGKLGQPVARVLAADTAVVLGSAMLGKPRGREEGVAMLGRLSGREHVVLSAIALWHDGRLDTALSTSEVRFRTIAAAEAAAYWDTGEPADKAGGYGIQGLGAVFVERLRGSYSGVMGLPLFETVELLRQAGMSVF
ncbi:MAG TPA: nucleoside triphosphate pyrophosphatase [Gammaproteobacteria bacterium]|nr:nucleoside triphosphate pyrophosphatase [Gammaproteobacteria bacterium]